MQPSTKPMPIASLQIRDNAPAGLDSRAVATAIRLTLGELLLRDIRARRPRTAA